MKVLFVTSEAYPFAMSGGLADVSGALPKALKKRVVGCRVVMPLYDTVSDSLKDKMKFLFSYTVPVSWRRQYCGVFEAKFDGVTYYLLDNQYYFKRGSLYGHYDDAERFAFFSRAAIDLLKLIDFQPDVIHCNDWQSALVPVYMDLYYKPYDPFYSGIKTLLTIHNIQYQGIYSEDILEDVFGISRERMDIMGYEGCVNLLKAGIETADRISTVSPTYSREILTPDYAHGLDGILRAREYKLSGIVNGIDTEVYDPSTDSNIEKNYSVDSFDDKKINKLALQKEMGLPERAEVPVISMVTRLVSHKGLDIVKYAIEDVLQRDVQLVILGSGDFEYESFFRYLKGKYPEKVGLKIGFIPALARKIYAGSDIFLMPSLSEPCGLSQMIALRYGTVPITRETGGLKDTVIDSMNGKGNGFTFANYNGDDLRFTIHRSIDAYADKDGWKILAKRCMECDNSWAKSASDYIKLYKSMK
ncbi:MAG: glycogen synthase GlgA [Clostridia bacterium]|nr:glycogen synthase GlgA [Clostridia bacterium]